jgi:hypothetical protein
MANAETVLAWLQEAGEYAFKLEDPRSGHVVGVRVDVLVHEVTVGVRVRRSGTDRLEYRNLSWDKLKHAETNPLLALIDQAVEAVGR